MNIYAIYNCNHALLLLKYVIFQCITKRGIYILWDVLLCSIAKYFYELCRILTSPLGELKFKQWVKFSAILHNKTSNKRSIIQHAKLLCLCGRISRVFICGECVTHVCETRNGISAGNPANRLVNSRRTRQTVFCGFDQAITGALFTFHNGKKSSFDRPNYTSIQVFHLKISVKKKRRKESRFDKQQFFS